MSQPEDFLTLPSSECAANARRSAAPSEADSPANCAAAERAVAERGHGRKKLSIQIERIRKAKSAADRLCKNAKMDAAMASVEILWEILFDYLSSNPELDEDSLASVSGIVQKLASSRTQLANFESKISTIAASVDSPDAKTGTLSEDTVAKIESALKLL